MSQSYEKIVIKACFHEVWINETCMYRTLLYSGICHEWYHCPGWPSCPSCVLMQKKEPVVSMTLICFKFKTLVTKVMQKTLAH